MTRVVHELGLEYELWGLAPTQALGTLTGHQIYFRARGSEWIYEVAEADDLFPSDGHAGFIRRGQWESSGAEHSDHENAARIIEMCSRDYLNMDIGA